MLSWTTKQITVESQMQSETYIFQLRDSSE